MQINQSQQRAEKFWIRTDKFVFDMIFSNVLQLTQVNKCLVNIGLTFGTKSEFDGSLIQDL